MKPIWVRHPSGQGWRVQTFTPRGVQHREDSHRCYGCCPSHREALWHLWNMRRALP